MKCCPPHRWPHRYFWEKKIINEKCHVHKNKIRQLFHDLHCCVLKCQYRKWDKFL